MMGSKAETIAKKVTSLVEPILEEMDFELVDVMYFSKQGRWVLRLYIDKEGGVTIDDCVRVSGEIGDLIDVKDVVEHEYVLEVSSPGLDRPLKKEKDLIHSIGKKVKLKMDFPLKNRRNFTGYLKDFRNGMLYLEVDGDVVELSWADVGKANLVYEF